MLENPKASYTTTQPETANVMVEKDEDALLADRKMGNQQDTDQLV